MRKLEITPTNENLINCYVNDAINRNVYLHRFVKFIDSIDDGFSVAVSGRWGCGKTFFVKQVKLILDAHNDNIKNIDEGIKSTIKNKWVQDDEHKGIILKKQACVYYDAWKYDNDEDPVLSILYEIVKELDYNYNFREDGDLADLVCSIFDIITGSNIRSIYEVIKSREQLFESVKKERELSSVINRLLDVVLMERGERLVLFIDELDRCKPSYAVLLLEKIKHYFSNRKVTFVFSINSEELVNTIRKYYGQDFDSSRYLDRFFDLRMDIPKLDIEKYFELIGFNTSRSSNIQDLIIKEIINKFGFEMREISRYMKLIKVASYAQAHNNYLIDDTYRFINACITPVILGVKLYNTKMYYEMIDGKDCTVLIDVLSKFKSKKYIKMLLNNGETFEGDAGTGTKVKVEDKIKNVYNALFVEQYNVFHEKEIVGNLIFCEENKKEINEIINLLSLDSNYRN